MGIGGKSVSCLIGHNSWAASCWTQTFPGMLTVPGSERLLPISHEVTVLFAKITPNLPVFW